MAALAIYLPKEAVKDKENDAVPSYPEKEINNDKDETESEDPKEDSKTIEENKTEEKKEDAKANNANQNNKKETKPSSNLNTDSNSGSSSSAGSTKPSKPTYSCPSGYELKGTKCVDTIAAEGCPGMVDRGGDMCIIFSEGHEVEGTSCPSGEIGLRISSFDGPDKYECYLIHKKHYSCPSDYVLSGAVCTKTIDATKK